MKYLFSSIFLIFLFSQINAQSMVSDEDLLSRHYDSLKALSKEDDCAYKKVPFDVEAWFQGKVADLDSIKRVLDFAEENLTWTTEQGPARLGFPLLAAVKSAVPHKYTYEEIPQLRNFPTIFLNARKWELYETGSKDSLQVTARDFHRYTTGSGSIYDESHSIESHNGTFATSYFVWDKDDSDSPLAGKAQAEIKYLSEYHKIELSKESIGDTFSIAEFKFVLVDIINKAIVHKMLKKKGSFSYSGTASLTVTENKKHLILPDLYLDPAGPASDGPCPTSSSSGFGMSEVPVHLYNYFRQNPEVTFEEFKKKHMLSGEALDSTETYFVLNWHTPIEKLIIYEPVYKIGRVADATFTPY